MVFIDIVGICLASVMLSGVITIFISALCDILGEIGKMASIFVVVCIVTFSCIFGNINNNNEVGVVKEDIVKVVENITVNENSVLMIHVPVKDLKRGKAVLKIKEIASIVRPMFNCEVVFMEDRIHEYFRIVNITQDK